MVINNDIQPTHLLLSICPEDEGFSFYITVWNKFYDFLGILFAIFKI